MRQGLEQRSLLAAARLFEEKQKTCVCGVILQGGSQPVCNAFPSSRCRHRLGSSEPAGEGTGGGGDRVHVPTAASPGVMDGCLLRRGSACTAPSAGSGAQPPTPGAAQRLLQTPHHTPSLGNVGSGSVNLPGYFGLRPSFSVSPSSVAILHRNVSPPLGSAGPFCNKHIGSPFLRCLRLRVYQDSQEFP